VKLLSVKVLLSVLVLTAVCNNGFCRMPPDSLQAFALSPDGKTILIGGNTRTLYVVDNVKNTVIKRIRLDGGIHFIGFTKDGSNFLVDDSDQIRIFNAKTHKETDQIKNNRQVIFTPDSGKLILMKDKKFEIRSISDIHSLREIPFPKECQVSIFDVNDDGQLLAVLYNQSKSKEKKAGWNKVPKELKDLKKKDWQKQNDGKSGKLIIYDLQNGKIVSGTDTWYTDSWRNAKMVMTPDGVTVFESSQYAVNVDNNGKTTSFKPLEKHCNNFFLDNDRGVFFASDFDKIYVNDIKQKKLDTFTKEKFKSQDLNDFKSFTVGSDGNFYLTSTTCQLVKISPDGNQVTVIPIY